MIEGESNPNRRQPEAPPRPEPPEQRRAQEFWNRVIEAVPLVASGIGRGRAPELHPSSPAETNGAAARQDGRAASGANDGSAANEGPSRTAGVNVWRSLIESQPAQPAAAASQTRSQGRAPGS